MAGVAILKLKFSCCRNSEEVFGERDGNGVYNARRNNKPVRGGEESTKLPVPALSSFLVYPVYHEVSYFLQSNSPFTNTYLFYMV